VGRTSLVLRPCALSANYTASQQRLQSCRELDSMEVARYDPVQGSIGCVSASRHETTGWPADGDPFTAEDVKFSFERDKGANASLRVEAFMYSEGSQSFLQDREIDAWYERQATERDRTRRETLPHRIQQKV